MLLGIQTNQETMEHAHHILVALAYVFERASVREKFIFNRKTHYVYLPDLRLSQQRDFINHVMQVALKLSESQGRHREIYSWALQYETRPAVCREEFITNYDRWFLSDGSCGYEYSYLSEEGRDFGRQVYNDFPIFFDALAEEILLQNTDEAPDIHSPESVKSRLIYIVKQ